MNIKCHKKRAAKERGRAVGLRGRRSRKTKAKLCRRSWVKARTQRAVNLALSESCANCEPGQPGPIQAELVTPTALGQKHIFFKLKVYFSPCLLATPTTAAGETGGGERMPAHLRNCQIYFANCCSSV